MLTMILLVFAFVLFVVAGLIPQPPAPAWNWRLLCFGLACWVLSELLGHAPATLFK